MLSLLTKNNKLVTKNNTLLIPNPNPPKSAIGFQAFDGSNRYFRRLKQWDKDCCYLKPRFDPNKDDGSFEYEKIIDCCCNSICRIVASERWYSCALPIGTIIPCPPTFNKVYSPHPDSCLKPPTIFGLIPILPSPINTPTVASVWKDAGCCNADGSKIYIELFDEIL